MIKKTIKYTDFNGEEREEDFMFHFSEAEIAEMEYSVEGGLSKLCEKVVKAKSTPELVKIFKSLILKAYGEKTPDGKRFVKSEELSSAFSQTPAYSKLFMELATDHNASSDFVNSLMRPVENAIKALTDARN